MASDEGPLGLRQRSRRCSDPPEVLEGGQPKGDRGTEPLAPLAPYVLRFSAGEAARTIAAFESRAKRR